MSVTELAERWETANRPRQNRRTGEWIGWSPKTAKLHRDNFVRYILPVLGDRSAASVTGIDLTMPFAVDRLATTVALGTSVGAAVAAIRSGELVPRAPGSFRRRQTAS